MHVQSMTESVCLLCDSLADNFHFLLRRTKFQTCYTTNKIYIMGGVDPLPNMYLTFSVEVF